MKQLVKCSRSKLTFLKENNQKIKKYMKISIITSYSEIKTSLICHLNSVIIDIVIKNNKRQLRGNMKKRKPLQSLSMIATFARYYEYVMKIPQKIMDEV